MKRSSIFFQAVTGLIGFGAFVFMLWEPHLEGRNVHSTLFQIYFHDPFLAYAYIASIPFYTALYQAVKVLGYAGKGKVYTPASVKALRIMKYCAFAMIGFAVAGVIIILLSDSDDHAGGVFMGNMIILSAIVMVIVAVKFEQKFKKGMDIKSGNNLTV